MALENSFILPQISCIYTFSSLKDFMVKSEPFFILHFDHLIKDLPPFTISTVCIRKNNPKAQYIINLIPSSHTDISHSKMKNVFVNYGESKLRNKAPFQWSCPHLNFFLMVDFMVSFWKCFDNMQGSAVITYTFCMIQLFIFTCKISELCTKIILQ